MGACNSKNIKAAKEQAVAKVEEEKAKREAAKQTEWLAEVVDEKSELFYGFEKWAETYEPKKEKAEKEDEGPSNMQKKMMKKVCMKINANIMKSLMEAVSQVLGPIEPIFAEEDPEFARFINAGAAVTMTYRFEYKNKKQFAFLRKHATGFLSTALITAISKEAEKRGVEEGQDIPPEMVDEIVADLTNKLTEQIEFRKQIAEDAMKNSPIFEASGADGEQLDEGVQKLVEFLQDYAASKVGMIVDVLITIVKSVIELVAKHRAAIIKYNAARKAIEADGGAAPSEEDGEAPKIDGQEEFDKARDEILAEIETKHGELDQAALVFVAGLVETMTGIPVDVTPDEEDAEGEEEKASE